MRGTLEISLLRSLIAVARHGSISGAALQVGRTQSALSTQMKRLEDVVGGQLLHRSGSGVQLTRLGERLLVHAHSILNQHEDAMADLSGTGLRGTIALGCPEDYLDIFLPRMLAEFSASHPDIEFEITSAPSNELRSLIQRQQIDIAIVSSELQEPTETPVRRTRLVWVCNDAKPKVLERPTVPLALSSPSTLDHQMAIEALRRAGIPYRIAFASDSLSGLVSIARSGAAVSVFTAEAVPDDLSVVTSILPQLPEIQIGIEVGKTTENAAVSEFRRAAVKAVLAL